MVDEPMKSVRYEHAWCAGQDVVGRIRWPICCESDTEADGTSELGLVPPIRIERTTNGLGICHSINTINYLLTCL